jgi:hypothetical protein
MSDSTPYHIYALLAVLAGISTFFLGCYLLWRSYADTSVWFAVGGFISFIPTYIVTAVAWAAISGPADRERRRELLKEDEKKL